MKTMVSRTLSVHKEHELLLKLETAGLNDELSQRVINSKNNNLAIKVVRLIQEAAASKIRAREIMGKNFFEVEKAIGHFRVDPTIQQLAALSEIPFSETVLKESKDTHILVAVFPLSILEIRDRVENKFFHNHDDAWYNKESFAKKRGEVSWQLICKTPEDNSTSKNWQKQQSLIGKDDEVPGAQVMVYTIIGHYLATGERLFEHFYIRTSSLDSRGDRVNVGRFDSEGLNVSWDSNPSISLGVSSARKKQI